MENIYGIIYKITNTINGKVYIGITTKNRGFNGRYSCSGYGVERVYNSCKSNGNGNTHLIRSIEKYGYDNFDVCHVFDVAYSKEELIKKERLYISMFESHKYSNGYNVMMGGEGIDKGNWSVKKDMQFILEDAKVYNMYIDYLFSEGSHLAPINSFNIDVNRTLYMKSIERNRSCNICGKYILSGKRCNKCSIVYDNVMSGELTKKDIQKILDRKYNLIDEGRVDHKLNKLKNRHGDYKVNKAIYLDSRLLNYMMKNLKTYERQFLLAIIVSYKNTNMDVLSIDILKNMIRLGHHSVEAINNALSCLEDMKYIEVKQDNVIVMDDLIVLLDKYKSDDVLIDRMYQMDYYLKSNYINIAKCVCCKKIYPKKKSSGNQKYCSVKCVAK